MTSSSSIKSLGTIEMMIISIASIDVSNRSHGVYEARTEGVRLSNGLHDATQIVEGRRWNFRFKSEIHVT